VGLEADAPRRIVSWRHDRVQVPERGVTIRGRRPLGRSCAGADWPSHGRVSRRAGAPCFGSAVNPILTMRAAHVSSRRQVAAAYALMTPALAIVLGVVAYPVAWETWVSLTDFSSRTVGTSAFVGTANYVRLLRDSGFW